MWIFCCLQPSAWIPLQSDMKLVSLKKLGIFSFLLMTPLLLCVFLMINYDSLNTYNISGIGMCTYVFSCLVNSLKEANGKLLLIIFYRWRIQNWQIFTNPSETCSLKEVSDMAAFCKRKTKNEGIKQTRVGTQTLEIKIRPETTVSIVERSLWFA